MLMLTKEDVMRRFMISILFVPALLQIAVCLCLAEDITSEKYTMQEKINYFQHRLLPKWTHGSTGNFFDDLVNARLGKLEAAASEIVGEEYARKMSVRNYSEAKGVLITFSPPTQPSECFFVYIVNKGDRFRFFTYEKTLDPSGSGDKGVIGEWKSDGAHGNLGPRKYDDPDTFVRELQELKEDS
jgi:hypothetical protein